MRGRVCHSASQGCQLLHVAVQGSLILMGVDVGGHADITVPHEFLCYVDGDTGPL